MREAFLTRGHDAYSCDVLPSNHLRASPGRHLQQDVTHLLAEKWDLVIAHPPCTFLTNSGVRWIASNPFRVTQVKAAAEFFLACYNANAKYVCVENPIMHKYGRQEVKVEYTQIIQPWQFGHGETKATCLWLKNLPPLVPTKIVEGRKAKVHKTWGQGKGKLLRSITYSGIAAAMAEQWGLIT